MNAEQTLEICKILKRYFKNGGDASRVVQDIQVIIDKKFEENKGGLASKDDIMRLENKMNDHLKWRMGTVIAVGGLIVALVKFF